MTRIQLIDLIKSHSKYFTEDGTADDVATVRYNELIDALLALPIDVPGDEEILMTESPHLETKAEAFGFRVGATWMRDEIIKRNRP
jgi:hypothetical protein